MRTIVDGTLEVIAPDLNVYTKEANIIRVINHNPNFVGYIIMEIDLDVHRIGGRIAEYAMVNNEVEIDLQPIIDIVSDSGDTSGVVTITTGVGQSVDVDFVIRGTSRPLFIPAPALPVSTLARVRAATGVNNIYLPPTKIIAPQAGADVLQFPICFKTDYELTDSAGKTYNGEVYDVARFGASGWSLYFEGDEIYHAGFERLDCNINYCTLRWIDKLTGLTKVATFEATKVNYKVSASTLFLTLDKSFDALKGETISFTARLGVINAYDVNYYADIITADVVECKTNFREWTKVNIEADDVTILDGNAETTEFAITINYLRNEY